ncbi:hypothetical protein LTR37_018568 [Vermiconidia calcicola]|uniref:Uncharacterized protein n=1 Tax=Vermiconidia calcicola TaxID=1690605 RepID=A0ACC3MGV8_9PEZI|nr:hypothetical protein LTR37_018568 [Vermiconidia calcicola]
MPPLPSRMTKNRAQPTRYRPGKAEADDPASDEESSEEEEDARPVAAKAPPPKATSFPSQKKLAVDLSKAGQQSASATKTQAKAPHEDLEGFVTASESSVSEGEGGSGSSDEEGREESSEEEESSSDDEAAKPMLAPKFISKAKRTQQAPTTPTDSDKAGDEERLRREKADALLQAQLEREAAARAAGKKYWDDDDINPEDEVDDTDDLDPEAERAAWKLRELKRVKRDRETIEEKEREREEIERRRNMSVEEREEEDRRYIEAQKEDREGKGKMGYMQKYFHKGAFDFNGEGQDEEVKRALNRDLAGARFVDDTGDKQVLPEYMRMRDMTRLGKKGRTKYKDLKDEDTGRWGVDMRRKREFEGVDERFRPDDGYSGNQRTGANDVAVGERRRRDDDSGRDGKRTRYD